MARKIISIVVISLFIFYWVITFIFVPPKNYLNISLLNQSFLFDSFFYQKWGLFAPPPKANERLYYVFENKKDSTDIKFYEVIEPITKSKSKKNPFNTEEDFLDYVLSNSINSIREGIININELIKHQEKTLKKTFTKSEKEKLYDIEISTTTGLQTLKNYSSYIANNNNFNIEKYNIKFIISNIEIIPFSERNNNKYIPKTEDLYVSKIYNLNK